MPLFAQDTPATAPAAQSTPGIDIGALAGAIADSLVNAVTRAIPDLIGGIGQAAGANVHSATGNLWNGLWTSDANVFTQTSAAQTLSFGPIAGYTTEAQTAAYGLVLFGVVLLGLRTMLSSFAPMHSETAGELVYGIATAVILTRALPVLMLRAVDVLNLALRRLAGVNLASRLPLNVDSDPIVTLVLSVLVVWYGVKFVIKSLKRLVVLAVLTPFGPIAILLRCIPATRWVSGWWART